MMCGKPGWPTGDGHLCAAHGGAPAAVMQPAQAGAGQPSAATVWERHSVPAWWQLLTWALIVAAVGYIGLIGVRIWALAHEDAIADELLANPGTVDGAAVDRFFAGVRLLDAVYGALIFVYLAVFLAWIFSARRVLTRLGHDRRAVFRHWTFVAWRITLIAVIMLAVFLRSEPLPDASDRQAFHDAVVTANQHQMLYSAARLIVLGLLIAAIVTVWNRARAASRPPL
jgi:hypothetical protein